MKLSQLPDNHAFQVKCPVCGAERGKKCQSKTDNRIKFDQFHNLRKAYADRTRIGKKAVAYMTGNIDA